MLKPSKALFLTLLTCITATGIGADSTKLNNSAKPQQIVIIIHQGNKGLLFEIRSNEYKKRDANYVLAELKLCEDGNRQIIAVLDDRVPLSAITEISEMAINAGFKDIRPFVSWHKTGRMAEIQLGPPIKSTMSAEKIEQRVEKER